jgi:Resolvase, N terminal domain
LGHEALSWIAGVVGVATRDVFSAGELARLRGFPEITRAELMPLPQAGDTLKFWKSDRWGRSAADVLATVNQLRDGVKVVSLTENFDLGTKEGRLMFGVLALAAEYELELRAERQADGIAAARRRQAEGRMLPGKKHIGRPPATGPAELAALRDLIAGGKSVRCPLAHRHQPGQLVPGGGRVPRLPGPAGELATGGQGVRVLRARYPLAHRHQPGQQVPGGGRVPRLPGPAGELATGGQGERVLRTRYPLAHRHQPGQQVPGTSQVSSARPWKTTATQTRASGENRVSTKPGVLQDRRAASATTNAPAASSMQFHDSPRTGHSARAEVLRPAPSGTRPAAV